MAARMPAEAAEAAAGAAAHRPRRHAVGTAAFGAVSNGPALRLPAQPPALRSGARARRRERGPFGSGGAGALWRRRRCSAGERAVAGVGTGADLADNIASELLICGRRSSTGSRRLGRH